MLNILYGSQTGTAEEVANRIAREAFYKGYAYQVMTMNEALKIHEFKLAIFVCSTTGEGEEPDNMQKFWKYLRQRSLPANLLGDLKFAVFGLGDSSYEKFNFAAKKLARRLGQLGGEQIIPRGDGDDQHSFGYDGALQPWLDQLWSILPISHCQLTGISPEPVKNFIPLAKLNPLESYLQEEAPFNAELVYNKRITNSEDPDVKDVRHLAFKTELDYVPGDVAVVWPENSSDEVDELLAVLGWVPESCFEVQPGRPEFRTPSDFPASLTISLRELLTRFLDILRPPSRYFFELLSMHVSDSHPLAGDHRRKLWEIGCDRGKDGMDSYLDYVWRPKRRPVEVLEDFRSVKLSVDLVFDLFPWIKPRSFSIASYLPKQEVHLLSALVGYKTVMKKDRVGLCSRWFTTLQPGSRIKMSINTGSMRLPDELTPATPILLLCAGTGLAPMLSFLGKLDRFGSRPSTYLFYGCRKKASDSLSVTELQAKHREWLQVFYEGSRDGPKGSPKVYLPDIVKKQADLIFDLLINPKCQIYLSGNSKLPAGVKAAFSEIAAGRGLDGSGFVQALLASGRFHSETWS